MAEQAIQETRELVEASIRRLGLGRGDVLLVKVSASYTRQEMERLAGVLRAALEPERTGISLLVTPHPDVAVRKLAPEEMRRAGYVPAAPFDRLMEVAERFAKRYAAARRAESEGAVADHAPVHEAAMALLWTVSHLRETAGEVSDE